MECILVHLSFLCLPTPLHSAWKVAAPPFPQSLRSLSLALRGMLQLSLELTASLPPPAVLARHICFVLSHRNSPLSAGCSSCLPSGVLCFILLCRFYFQGRHSVSIPAMSFSWDMHLLEKMHHPNHHHHQWLCGIKCSPSDMMAISTCMSNLGACAIPAFPLSKKCCFLTSPAAIPK